MARFLYFLETAAATLTAAAVAAHGLGYALDGVGAGAGGKAGDPVSTGAKGPEGLSGRIFASDGQPARYEPDRQTWTRLPPHPGALHAVTPRPDTPPAVSPVEPSPPQFRAWVGLENDGAKPGPADLARRKSIDGEAVRLRDGHDWIIPIARSIAGGATLPSELVLADDGVAWVPREAPEFATLCREAETAFDLLCGGEPDENGDLRVMIPFADGMRIAVAAMAVNYRVGPMEVSLLRLFSDDEMIAVLRAVCDARGFERVMESRKKNSPVPASSPTADGSPGSAPATSQPSAT